MFKIVTPPFQVLDEHLISRTLFQELKLSPQVSWWIRHTINWRILYFFCFTFLEQNTPVQKKEKGRSYFSYLYGPYERRELKMLLELIVPTQDQIHVLYLFYILVSLWFETFPHHGQALFSLIYFWWRNFFVDNTLIYVPMCILVLHNAHGWLLRVLVLFILDIEIYIFSTRT